MTAPWSSTRETTARSRSGGAAGQRKVTARETAEALRTEAGRRASSSPRASVPALRSRGDVQITNEELVRALRQEASRYPGQEKQLIEFYTKNQNAMAQLRAPIYEEKVVDYILEKATVTDKTVSREDLMKEIGDE
jgi:FKBP-type peptidyl-prolyl cis-trans isomerase (trigger factor)